MPSLKNSCANCVHNLGMGCGGYEPSLCFECTNWRQKDNPCVALYEEEQQLTRLKTAYAAHLGAGHRRLAWLERAIDRQRDAAAAAAKARRQWRPFGCLECADFGGCGYATDGTLQYR